MKIQKIISMMMIAAMAIFATSCDSSDDGGTQSYDLDGDKYTGDLTIEMADINYSMTQNDVVFYADADDSEVDIMMPEVSFMSGLMPNLDMALVSIPLISSDPNTYSLDEAQMVGIYDRLPLINDVIQSISNVSVVMDGDKITVAFDCAISTDNYGDCVASVTYEGTTGDIEEEDGEEEETLEEGFHITISSGTYQIEDVTVAYNKDDASIVINGFSYSPSLTGTELPIVGVTESVEGDTTTLTGDDIEVNYTFMYQEATSVVNDLECEIVDGIATMTFSISYNGSDYPCTYYGAISVE